MKTHNKIFATLIVVTVIGIGNVFATDTESEARAAVKALVEVQEEMDLKVEGWMLKSNTAEQKLELEDWMMDKSFKVAEPALKVEDWMLQEFEVKKSDDSALIVEDWMLNFS